MFDLLIETSTTNGEFKATVSIKKQTCINTDKEIGDYVVDIKALLMLGTNPLR